MTSKQTDTVAMTEQQLDGVSGGPHIRNFWFTAPIQQRRSNRTRYTGDDADALLPALGATDRDHKDW
jgi:hypothetical protein